VIKLNWGIKGTGVAGAITQASSTLIIYSYSYQIEELKETFFFPSFRVLFQGLLS
jgi:Na+-driven multidrug efflux pump